jgi:hypothetical protein
VGRAVLLSQSQNRQSEFRYDIAEVSAELSSPPLALFGRQLQSQFFQPRPSRLEDSYQVDRGVRQTSGSRRSQSCAVPVSCRDAWCIPTCAASALHGRALRLRSRMKAWSVAGLPIAAAASRFRVLRSPSRCDGVLVAPGDCFDAGPHFRVGFGAQASGFEEALDIIVRVLASKEYSMR